MIKSCHRLQALDSCLCLFVFFPSMLFYWRGIWDLLGVYIFPGDAPKCHWVTAGIGACSIVGYYTHPLLSHLLITVTPSEPSHGSSWVYIIVTRLYMLVFAILAMAYWRGVWGLADYYLLQFGWKSGLIGLIVCHSILLGLRSSRTTIFPPFVVALDTRKDLLVPSTCFQTQLNWSRPSSVVKYTLDSLLTHYVIMTLTVMTWRSSLSLLDIFLLPDDWKMSNVLSSVIGVAGSVLLFALETPLSHLANHIQRSKHRCSYWLRLFYEDVVYLVVFAAESLLWRGLWNLNTMYLIPDPLVGGWVNHAIGTVLLLSFQLLSYVAGCGCAKDAQGAEDDTLYATKYLRVVDQYLRERRESKTEESGKHGMKGEEENDDNDDVVGNGKVIMEKEKKSLVNETNLSSSSDSSTVLPQSTNPPPPSHSSTRIL